MYKSKETLIIGLFIFLVGCQNPPKNLNAFDKVDIKTRQGTDTFKVNNEFLKGLNIQNEDSIIRSETKYTVFVNFDGTCSACVVSFLDLLKKIKEEKTQMPVKYLFIASANDAYLIKYYMGEFNLNLSKNEFLLIDNKHSFEKYNPFVEKQAMNVLLTNKSYEVIVSGNPLESKEILKIYSNLTVFK